MTSNAVLQRWEEAISCRRLLISGSLVALLLVTAGILELLLLAFPAPSTASAESASPVAVVRTRVQEVDGLIRSELGGRVAQLQDAGALIADGEPLDGDRAFALVATARDYTSAVAAIDQREVLPSGCELVALTAILQAEGYSPDLEDLATRHLRIGSDIVTEYLGDPRVNGGGFPISIADAANSWLGENNLDGRALDLTGTDFGAVLALADLGYPVAIWVTEDMKAPSFTGTPKDGLQWYRQEHCVVVYGSEGSDVLIADSLRGDMRSPAADVREVYDRCGKLALMVDPAMAQEDDGKGSPWLPGSEGSLEWNAEHSGS